MYDNTQLQRARELLAAEYDRDGLTEISEMWRHGYSDDDCLEAQDFRAILAALSEQQAVPRSDLVHDLDEAFYSLPDPGVVPQPLIRAITAIIAAQGQPAEGEGA